MKAGTVRSNERAEMVVPSAGMFHSDPLTGNGSLVVVGVVLSAASTAI